jgi:hypothetical protein
MDYNVLVVTTMNRVHVTPPTSWHGNERSTSGSWKFNLTDSDRDEIDAALAGTQKVGVNDLSPSTFPLPGARGLLRKITAELAHGTGLAKLIGLRVEPYPDAQLRTLYLALGTHMGTVTNQNRTRGLLRDIYDRSADGGRRVDNAEALNWHNEGTDIVDLLRVREAASDGVSKISGMTAILNAMLERCPQLLEVLFQDFNRCTPGDEVGGTDGCHA